jgi:hypothetical protein
VTRLMASRVLAEVSPTTSHQFSSLRPGYLQGGAEQGRGGEGGVEMWLAPALWQQPGRSAALPSHSSLTCHTWLQLRHHPPGCIHWAQIALRLPLQGHREADGLPGADVVCVCNLVIDADVGVAVAPPRNILQLRLRHLQRKAGQAGERVAAPAGHQHRLTPHMLRQLGRGKLDAA